MEPTPERTEAQREAARINGAQSKGPKTEEGKAISSQNARKHGLSAKRVILEDEDRAEFEEIHAGYRESLRPVGEAEEDLVDEIAIYRFRLKRAITLSVVSTDLDTMRLDPVVSGEVSNPDRDLILARAVTERHHRGDSDAFFRYENHYSRLFNRALRNLRIIQKDRRARELAESPHAHSHPKPAESKQQAQPAKTQPPPESQPLCSINDLIAAGAVPSLRDRLPSRHIIRPQNEPEPFAPPHGENAAA